VAYFISLVSAAKEKHNHFIHLLSRDLRNAVSGSKPLVLLGNLNSCLWVLLIFTTHYIFKLCIKKTYSVHSRLTASTNIL